MHTRGRVREMKIGITGGCGFVGSNLAERFTRAGHTVSVLDNLTRGGSSLNRERLQHYGVTFIHADIRNREELQSLYGCDAVLNCAAQASLTRAEREPVFNFENNTTGLLNLLEIVRETKAPLVQWGSNKIYPAEKINAIPTVEKDTRFEWYPDTTKDLPCTGLTVSVSSAGEPLIQGINEEFPLGTGGRSMYGASKVCSDILCQEYRDAFNLPIFANRFSCLAGPWQYGMVEQGWYVWFIIAAYFKVPLTYYGWEGKQVRDVLFIDDVFRLVERQLSSALRGESSGGVYNLGGGVDNALSLCEHVSRLRAAGLKPRVETPSEPQRRGDHRVYISDSSKARNDFGWSPEISLEAGLEECLSWVTTHSGTLASLYSAVTG
jgi:CDP-paratose 2-epimerase